MQAEKPYYPQISKRDVKLGQRAHAKKRAKQRYGLKLNRSDILFMIQKINNKEAIYLCTESRTRTHYILYFKEMWVIVVYDRGKNNIATFMPRSSFFDRYIKLISKETYGELKNKGILEYLEKFKTKEGDNQNHET